MWQLSGTIAGIVRDAEAIARDRSEALSSVSWPRDVNPLTIAKAAEQNLRTWRR